MCITLVFFLFFSLLKRWWYIERTRDFDSRTLWPGAGVGGVRWRDTFANESFGSNGAAEEGRGDDMLRLNVARVLALNCRPPVLPILLWRSRAQFALNVSIVIT